MGEVQTLAGPVLTVPYKKLVNLAVKEGEEAKQVEEKHYAHFLPEN
jgi:inner membrane protein involved in colicin E2 resistance